MPGFGPLGPRAATVRPPKDVDAYMVQTWFKNCSAPGAADGTIPTASWFNHLIGQFVYAAGQAGVALSNDDDYDKYLWEIIQQAIANALSGIVVGGDTDGDGGVIIEPTVITAYKNLPLFPEILTSTKKLAVTNNGDGTITINTGQSFLWRGWRKITLDDLALAARTVAHSASKTYHLRWYAPGHALADETTYPNGRILLQDLADPTYNPTTAAETDVSFDSDFDSMLVARVVTNGANAPTVLPLVNANRWQNTYARTTYLYLGSSYALYRDDAYTTDLARTPNVALSRLYEGPTADHLDGAETGVSPQVVNRYGITVRSYVSVDGVGNYAPIYSFLAILN